MLVASNDEPGEAPTEALLPPEPELVAIDTTELKDRTESE